VDDDPAVLEVVAEMLAELGHDVAGVGSADQARVSVLANGFDLVLIDTPMFALAGIELAKQLKAANIPVLMMAAGDDMTDRLTAENLPYVIKPFCRADLVAAIAAVTTDLA
jgi:DNA-binding response OmpR family regulator